MITDIERALNDGRAPWKEIEYRCKDFWIFRDQTAPSENYLCFVPTFERMDCLLACYKAAYQWGYNGVQDEKWQGFNIIQSVGDSAGQKNYYPHIHMLPRISGDLDS
jgi:hypothetical protein